MESRYKLETPSLEVTEQNSTKLCQHMLDSEPDLKRDVQNLAITKIYHGIFFSVLATPGD